jgi:4-hydroxybenzoate polyprenyltransferase
LDGAGQNVRITDRFPKLPFLLSVSRLDKPIGIYLLLWPTLWGLWIAAEGFPGWHLLFVFVLGTVVTRSAGCVINDIADRKFDGQVKRTSRRPLVTGELPVKDAIIFMALLLLIALALVITTNLLTIGLAAVAVVIAGLYPLMKRITYLPQVVLGIAFSFGIPLERSLILLGCWWSQMSYGQSLTTQNTQWWIGMTIFD